MEGPGADKYSDGGERRTSVDDSSNVEASKGAIGILFFFLAIVGLIINSAIIHTFRHSSTLQTPVNVLIMGCVLCDLTMTLIGHPFVIASCFHGDWIYGQAWCEGYGFIVTLLGVSSICILTAVAIERYFVLTQAPFAKKITTFKAAMTILSCFGYGLLWATFPLVGWGRFVVEPGRLSCGPDWTNTASSSRSYVIVMLLLVFMVPITIIGLCYLRIFVTVTKHTADEHTARLRANEIHVAIASVLIVSTFLLAWAPYAVMSVWTMSNDPRRLPDFLAIFAPLMTKSVSFWNPLVYVVRNKEFRQAIKRIVFGRFSINRVNDSSMTMEPAQGQSSSK